MGLDNWYSNHRKKSNTLSNWLSGAGGFPGGSDGKESACNAGDPGSVLGSGQSPGEGNGTPLQYSCLENSVDREAWQATVHGIVKSQTRLSDLYSHRWMELKLWSRAVFRSPSSACAWMGGDVSWNSALEGCTQLEGVSWKRWGKGKQSCGACTKLLSGWKFTVFKVCVKQRWRREKETEVWCGSLL